MTNEWLQGYLAGLKNISEAIEVFQKDKIWDEEVQIGFKIVRDYINQTKENYKELVKELNAKSENKKT
jgi:hypothetical protein